MKKLLTLLLAGVFCMGMTACNLTPQEKPSDGGTDDNTPTVSRVADKRTLTPEEYTFLHTVGTDALGRKIAEADGVKDGTRYVGIWYSLWLGQHAYMQTGIYDNEKLLSTPEGAAKLASTEDCEETRLDEFHFCSEPLYGYYNMLDPWVVTRHIELLTMAGMDYICFDTTNATVYQDVARLVLDTLQKFQKQGFKVPKAMFYVNSYSGTTAHKIYNEFYRTEKYDDVWFSPNGKPMLVGITSDSRGASDQTMGSKPTTDILDNLDQSIRDRFEIHESQWPQGYIEHEDALPWMTWQYPQNVHPNLNAISVSVAQHDPQKINFSHMHPHSSRGFDHVTGKLHENWWEGQNFESQWKTVFDYEKQNKKVENVLLCGWNEWMAIKTFNGNETVFCDVYNEQYSRDIEMSKGECGDNFYLQMIRNMRTYKHTDAKHYTYQRMTINMNDESLAQWNNVRAHYRDFAGDAMKRNFKDAVGKDMYTDNSARNDITDVKVVHSATDLYVYVQTAEDITAHNGTDENWMTLLIGTDNADKSFEGYDFTVNRHPQQDGKTSIEKSTGGYNWTSAGNAEYKVYGNVILYKIPLSALGLKSDACHIQLKVTDNVTHPDDIMDYYVSGDCAPMGRLSYNYGY